MLLVKSPEIADKDSSGSAQDYSIALLFKTLGLLGVPFMTLLFTEGIKLGGGGLGLPYYASAVRSLRSLALLHTAHISLGRICDSVNIDLEAQDRLKNLVHSPLQPAGGNVRNHYFAFLKLTSNQ